MFLKIQKKPRVGKIIFIVLTFLCVFPILYFSLYRLGDYYICRSFISLKLGMGFSPYKIEGYIQDSLSPGITRGEVFSNLEEIGNVEVISLGRINDVWSDQVTLKICTHPLNRVTVFTYYSSSGKLVSMKVEDK